MDNDLFYRPEDGFWDGLDRLGFEAAHLHGDWPASSNPFIKRMAQNLAVGCPLSGLSAVDLMQLAGEATRAKPGVIHRYLVVPQLALLAYTVVLIEQYPLSFSPLFSDNSCVFLHALQWMAERHSAFEISVTPDATFWIHRP